MAPPGKSLDGGRAGGVRKKGGAGNKVGATNNKKKGASRASLKNMIRGCQRLLAKGDLDAKGRVAQEAKLAELQHKVEEVQRAERERKYSVMYHRVKFFDRVKVERRVKQLEKVLKEAVLEGDEETVKRAKEELVVARDHVLYVKHFPKGEKYVSIVKGEGEHIESERRRLMALAKAQQREEAMMTEADEGLGGAPIVERDADEAGEAEEEVEDEEAVAVAPKVSSRRKAAAVEKPEAAEATAAAPVKKSSRRKSAAAAVPSEEVTLESKAGNSSGGVGLAGVRAVAEEAKEEKVAEEVFGGVAGDVFSADDDFFMSAGDVAAAEAERRIAAVVPKETHAELEAEARRRKRPKRVDGGWKGAKGATEGGGKGSGKGKGGDWRAKGGASGGHRADGEKGVRRAAPQGKAPQAAAAVKVAEKKEPLRTRAEGGRKRRKRKD